MLVRLWNKHLFVYVNHARIRSWNQPVLSKESKVSCSRIQRGPLMGLELTTDRYPPITSQTRYPLRHAASSHVVEMYMCDCVFLTTERLHMHRVYQCQYSILHHISHFNMAWSLPTVPTWTTSPENVYLVFMLIHCRFINECLSQKRLL